MRMEPFFLILKKHRKTAPEDQPSLRLRK